MYFNIRYVVPAVSVCGLSVGKNESNNILSLDITNIDDLPANSADDHNAVPFLLPDSDYFNLVSRLNQEHRQFFYTMIRKFKVPDQSDYEIPFLSGGARTGKTHLTKAIVQCALRCFRRPDLDPSDITVLVMASYGIAATHLDGQTIHHALGLKIGKSPDKILAISPERLQFYQNKYPELKFVVIDEISVVGATLLYCIDMRLREITGRDVAMGGIPTLLIGDLFQLAPIMDNYPFEVPRPHSVPYSAFAGILWDFVRLFELKKIMRQANDQLFAEKLNRLREGKQTPQDIAALNNRVFSKHILSDSGVSRICRRNKEVRDHNDIILNNFAGERYLANALDSVSGEFSSCTLSDTILSKVVNLDPKDTGQLHKELNLCIGLRYMLTINISTSDKLCNGKTGVLRKVVFRNNLPSMIWLEFEDSNVGHHQRALFSNYFTDDISLLWTPIVMVTQVFSMGKNQSLRIARKQFPIVFAGAITIHKSQGNLYSCNSKYCLRKSFLFVCFCF